MYYNFGRNRRTFFEVCRGVYGRRILYTDVSEITEENIVRVVGNVLGDYYFNRECAEYLWRYKNGDQPILYREKTIRDDVNNPVVENHAWEIVRYQNAQTNGEPIQCVSLQKEDYINTAVDRFNSYCRAANKHARDITSGDWVCATGIGYKAVQRVNGEVPFRIAVPTPLNTFMIYNASTDEPMLAVQELKDVDGNLYKLCFSATHEYRIQGGALTPLYNSDGTVVHSRLHAFGGIPIIEYINNSSRMSDIEIVITMLDAINNMQSNRMDAIEQFVQSWIKFVNCDIDADTFEKMKLEGALVVRSNNGENRADVDIISQELNQSETQVAKDDLWNNILTIIAMPNKEGNTGGDTQGAVELRNGWALALQAVKLKDAYTIESEKRLDTVLLNVIRQAKGANDCPLGIMDYEVQVNRNPTDNLQVRAQVLLMLLQAGIHPLIAIKKSGLWGDSEKTYLLSKPYLEALYKTIDEIEDKERQEAAADAVIAGVNNGGVITN